ncbi:MAG: GNAT family N-acetyltransferase [Candidatus Cloacimonadales bacterium]|nr:GNAT family N-acetyltransferase [Candidatus Cloacimonadales bacterium]
MKFEKINSQLKKEFEDQLQSKVRKKIITFIEQSDNLYFIKADRLLLGFIQVTLFENNIRAKLYLDHNWKENYRNELTKCISDLLKNYKQNFISFSDCFDSRNILDKIEGIDYMYQYEFNDTIPIQNSILNSEFEISNKINNLNDLIDFHYLCYSNDAEFMNSNWDKMLRAFPEAPFPKITFFACDQSKIIGSCIGYYIPAKNKKYLYSICVHPDFRNHSIGENLLSLFLSAKPDSSCYLTVYKSAESAIKLYEKMGFEREKTVEVVVCNDDSSQS